MAVPAPMPATTWRMSKYLPPSSGDQKTGERGIRASPTAYAQKSPPASSQPDQGEVNNCFNLSAMRIRRAFKGELCPLFDLQ